MKQTIWILSKQILKKSFESKENLLFTIIQFFVIKDPDLDL